MELMPEIDALAHANPRKVEVQKINVGSRETAKAYKQVMNLNCLPTVILYDEDDEEIDRWDADMEMSFQAFIDGYVK
jgi:thiol-disulfide isomerase/thioredoxin